MHEILEQLDSALAVVLSGLDARQTQLTPRLNPEKWSIQQIVEHLLLSYRSTAEVLQTRVDKGSPTRASPSLQQRVGQLVVITLGRFPRGRLAPAEVAPPMCPTSLRDGAELTRRIKDDLVAMDTAAQSAEALFGSRRSASHLVLGPLSVQQWRKFHLVHGRHHVQQVRRIRQDYQV